MEFQNKQERQTDVRPSRGRKPAEQRQPLELQRICVNEDFSFD